MISCMLMVRHWCGKEPITSYDQSAMEQFRKLGKITTIINTESEVMSH